MRLEKDARERDEMRMKNEGCKMREMRLEKDERQENERREMRAMRDM